MKVCIISGPAMAMTHGTGAQLLRIFAADTSFRHFYWRTVPFGKSEYNHSYLLMDKQWPWYRGARFIDRVRTHLGQLWWPYPNSVINKKRFAQLLQREHIQSDVAYVVVADEEEAKRANSLLQELNCPYVVHLMDLCHEFGLQPSSMPYYQQLLENAHSVLVLNEMLADEVRKFRVKEVKVVAFGHDVNIYKQRVLDLAQPIRIIISGNIHPIGCTVLAEAWPQIKKQFPQVELIYTGAAYETMPHNLKKIVNNCGYLSNDAYEALLDTCHLAYLTGPDRINSLSRYSVPSRISDYFMHGLPVFGYILPDTATERFVAPLVPDAVHLARNSNDVVVAAKDLLSSAERWDKASGLVHQFAINNLSSDTVRIQVNEALINASQSGAYVSASTAAQFRA